MNFNTTLALNDTTIYEYDPYFTATLDSLDLDLSVTVGAKIVYNVLTSTLGKVFLFFLNLESCFSNLDMNLYSLFLRTMAHS